jgi:hypothetical protein
MSKEAPTPASGESIHVYVPHGHGKNVEVHEVDPKTLGHDVTIQVSRERKAQVSKAVGVIVK